MAAPGGGRAPDAAAFAAARRATGWERFRFGPATATRRDARAWIDSGAFGKGAALRAARDALVAAGATDAFLNFGGQVLALRADPATPWEVPIAHPRVRTRPATTLLVADGSVATSGQSEQTVVVDGGGVGHILDPRSGQPVTPWGSVSVVEQDPLRADALATALFVMGPEAGWAWAERHAIAALFVVDAGATVTLRATSALDAYGARAASKGTRR